ncbi:MAG: hypothetical protein ACLFVQ_10980 [Chitinispirillaceae bacterium]
MKKKTLVIAVMAMLIGAVFVSSEVLTVGKSGSMFSTVQAAIDAAHAGDEIVIKDLEVYEEQVTFIGKRDLVLRSEDPASPDKPVIRWFDDENVGPKTYEESIDTQKVNYDKNGALRIIESKNIIVEGIIIDGVQSRSFSYPFVWDENWRHTLGNVALLLNSSSSVIVRNCEMKHAFFGILCIDLHMAKVLYDINPGLVDSLTLGGHLFEHNRVHDNSFGLFVESLRGIGSTFRFNLFYSNFHSEDVLLNLSDNNYSGGAIYLNNVLNVPLAIHNNTFWNNYLLIAGFWNPGGQHLLFNNIYGKPRYYWSDGYPEGVGSSYKRPYYVLDGQNFPNRSKNCLYSAQTSAPVLHKNVFTVDCLDKDTIIAGFEYINITTGIDYFFVPEDVTYEFVNEEGETCELTVSWYTQPGALITHLDHFSEKAEMRWLEVPFLSTDPQDPEFLEPDWNDAYVQKYIKGKGWAASGIVNGEGDNCDIGAVQSNGYPSGSLMIRPNSFLEFDHQTRNADFTIVIESDESLSDLEIKYLNLVSDVPKIPNGPAIDASAIHSLNIPNKALTVGSNSLQLQLPSVLGESAFIEMIVAGENAEGKSVVSNIAFIPFRQDISKFRIETVSPVLDQNGDVLLFVPGSLVPITSLITDEFGNPISFGPVSVSFESLDLKAAVVSEIREYADPSVVVAEILVKEDAAPGDTFRIVATLDVNGALDTVTCVVADPSSPVTIRQKINMPENLSIQLVDLRGRTVDKFTGSLTDYQNRIRRTRNVSGRGVYLMKVTDLKTGKKSVHRLVGQKLRNAVFKLK